MNRKRPLAGSLSRILTAIIACVVLTAIMAGCQTGSYGRIAFSREVTDMFNNYQIPSGPKYYFSGPNEVPFAFIGVNPEYALQSSLWKPVRLTPPVLRRWLNTRGGERKDVSVSILGGNILGPNDERIGYWYSVRDRGNIGAIKMGDGNTVYITPPRSDPPGKSRKRDRD